MTRLTGTRDPQQATMPAPSQRPGKTQRRSPLGLLADHRARLGLGTAAVLVTALSARRNRIGHCEAEAFRAVNGLPDSLYVPAWVIMQLGTLGAAPAAAGAALLAHDRKLAGRLLAAGTGTWALSKLVKQMVRRPRPAALVSGTRTHGRDASGLGYLSGHAGVAVALGSAAFPRLSRSGRAVVAAAVPVVGLSRIYVGAHLPLDIAGGAALGLAVDAAVALAEYPSRHKYQPDALPGLRQVASGQRGRAEMCPLLPRAVMKTVSSSEPGPAGAHGVRRLAAAGSTRGHGSGALLAELLRCGVRLVR